jgi:hypothetical protein
MAVDLQDVPCGFYALRVQPLQNALNPLNLPWWTTSVQITKVLTFRCTAGRCVFGIELEHDFLTAQCFQLNRLCAGCFTFEVFNHGIEYWSGQYRVS